MMIECRTLLLFAMKREATPLLARCKPAQHDTIVDFTGIGRDATRGTVLRLLERVKPARVIAAGFCGALVPGLKVGDIVESPHIYTSDRLISDPAEKARLATETGARAVDMESSAIAEVCAERGLPFTAIRAVSDTCDTALSPELVRLLSGGNVSIARACFALLKKPKLLREFLRLRRDTNLAAERLAQALIPLISDG
jgi:adenosylhomocysteine nucleosidase